MISADIVGVQAGLTVEGLDRTASPDGDAVSFRVLTDKGEPAIRDGVLVL